MRLQVHAEDGAGRVIRGADAQIGLGDAMAWDAD